MSNKQKVTNPKEWLQARLAVLEKEKQHAQQAALIAQEIRNLPKVLVTELYKFDTAPPVLGGAPATVSLKDLFGDKSQLIVYHFMFSPEDEDGCWGCSFQAGNFPDLRYLAEKDTALAVVSRAPISKIAAFQAANRWTKTFPWYSSLHSSFNYDFQVTLDPAVKTPVEYNYKQVDTTKFPMGEQPGFSVFTLGEDDGQVYHTYSTYQALDRFHQTYTYLDITPKGRQEGPMGPAGFKLPRDWYEAEEEEEKKKGEKSDE
ncbi:Bacterial protein of unknown function (DUF899) domain containing protein [Rhypophila decipiens]